MNLRRDGARNVRLGYASGCGGRGDVVDDEQCVHPAQRIE